jgi:hypothetical protein
MTVLIYVNTSKQVGDPDHIKVFANQNAAEKWFEENDPEGVAFTRPNAEDSSVVLKVGLVVGFGAANDR